MEINTLVWVQNNSKYKSSDPADSNQLWLPAAVTSKVSLTFLRLLIYFTYLFLTFLYIKECDKNWRDRIKSNN